MRACRQLEVMVVDPEEDVCTTVRSVLERRGYKVNTFLDAASALVWTRTAACDVAVIDTSLHSAKGIELAETVLHDENHPAVVTVTGYGDIESALEHMGSASRDYIAKPFHPVQLASAVERGGVVMGLVYTTEAELERMMTHRTRQGRDKCRLRRLSTRALRTLSQSCLVTLGRNAASIWALAHIGRARSRQVSGQALDLTA